MKEINELRKLSSDELNKKLLDLRQHQFKLRMKKANGTLEKPDSVRKTRRSIAQIKTLLTEKIGVSHGK